MEIKVNFLDKLRLEAKFDDFTVISDQPIRYKGDGSAPGPFDYFLASSALCAAYFVKLYCDTRNISTENIRLSQNNIVDPENRYQQIFKIQVEHRHFGTQPSQFTGGRFTQPRATTGDQCAHALNVHVGLSKIN